LVLAKAKVTHFDQLTEVQVNSTIKI